MLYFLLFGFVLWQNSFFPHFCVKIYAVQKYYPNSNTSISIILSTTTTVTTQSTASTTSIPPTSTDQYSLSLSTSYVKADGIGAFHSTLKMKATRCIGPHVSNVLLSKATCWQKLYSYWLAKQRVAFKSNALWQYVMTLLACYTRHTRYVLKRWYWTCY